MPRRTVIARSPWRWVLAAIWLSFTALQLPQLFQPVPDYAQHDNFEFFMYYAVPALISAVGLAGAFIALRSGLFADANGVQIRPVAGLRSKRLPIESIRAVTVNQSEGPLISSVSPALIDTDGQLINLWLALHNTPTGRRRAHGKAQRIAQTLNKPLDPIA
ncbi:hypothetical protein [Kribbella sp. NPDC055071]